MLLFLLMNINLKSSLKTQLTLWFIQLSLSYKNLALNLKKNQYLTYIVIIIDID